MRSSALVLPAFMIAALTGIPGSGDRASAQERSPHANYILRCAGCHGMSGAGTERGGVPPFPGSVGHIAGSDLGRTYLMHVPGVVSSSLNDAEIAAVMNYVLDIHSTGVRPFTAEEVARRRALPVDDVVALRRRVVAELEAEGLTVSDYPWQ